MGNADSPGLTPAYEWGHRPALTGLRTIAVYLVVLFHGGITAFEGGFIGVDFFFVLSGFLVCQVLMTDIDRSGRVRLVRFYARRFRRLLPASLLMIAVTSIVFIGVMPRIDRVDLIDDARAALLYVANWNLIAGANDYWAAADSAKSPFLHFWSLSIEEQYYFIFPALFLVGVRFTRGDRRHLLPLLILIAAASLILQLVYRDDALRSYYGTDTRVYQMLVGAALATWLRTRRRGFRSDSALASITAAVMIGALVVMGGPALGDPSPTFRGIAAAGISLAIIAALEAAPSGLTGRVLSTRSLVYLGDISYGTYLWHWPVIVVADQLVDVGPWTLGVLSAVAGSALASLSFHLVEQPIRWNRRLDRVPRGVIVGSVSISVLAAVWVVPNLLRDDARPVVRRASPVAVNVVPESASVGTSADGASTGGESAVDGDASDEVSAAIDPSSLDLDDVKSKKKHHACVGKPIEKCVVHRGDSGIRVHVIGDSHASASVPLFAEVARELDLTLSASTSGSCPWQPDLQSPARKEGLRARCYEMREDAYARIIPELDPHIVILVHRAYDSPYWIEEREHLGLQEFPQGDPFEEATLRGIEDFIRDGRRIIILEPVPVADGFNPLSCLSGARSVDECTFVDDAGELDSERFLRGLAAASRDIITLDIDRLVCPNLPVCSAVIDGKVVRRDSNHIAWDYSEHIAPHVTEMIVRSQILEALVTAPLTIADAD